MYCKTTTAKELWESFEKKYKTEDARTKKHVVARFLEFKMVDAKTVMSQVQDLQVVLHIIHAEGMNLSETFQEAAMIKKLPPSWVDFKNYLKHKRKEMSVEDLIVRLVRLPKREAHRQANVIEHMHDDVEFVAMVSDLTTMISEMNLVGFNTSDWWVDTGVTRHVCSNKSLFSSFKEVTNGEELFMVNSATSEVKGEGDVMLKMTFGKELKLKNVFWMPRVLFLFGDSLKTDVYVESTLGIEDPGLSCIRVYKVERPLMDCIKL
ncbi:hypothetical protein Tco_0790874 [Tanacetum coccineum]